MARANAWPVAAASLTIGSLTLALGLLVYAADRNPANALLFPAFAALASGPIFGAIGSWLPSFVHPFAFSLFTAAAASRAGRPAYGACALWWAVNVVFEVAQINRFSDATAEALHRLFGHGAAVNALANYALQGRFDRADIVAATAGSLAAAALLRLLDHDKDRHEQ